MGYLYFYFTVLWPQTSVSESVFRRNPMAHEKKLSTDTQIETTFFGGGAMLLPSCQLIQPHVIAVTPWACIWRRNCYSPGRLRWEQSQLLKDAFGIYLIAVLRQTDACHLVLLICICWYKFDTWQRRGSPYLGWVKKLDMPHFPTKLILFKLIGSFHPFIICHLRVTLSAGVRFPAGTRDFPLLHSVQACHEVHSISHPNGYWRKFPQG
jgi:hypothetical protein